jgi:hypothetical protein
LAHGRVILAASAIAVVLALAPATASAAGLIAAYEQYVTGKGFDIRIVNAATGAQIAVPAGVNTNDDELHPALSADGRSLVFTRMTLLPKLNGDIVPPAQRTLIWVDRQTGASQAINGGAGGTGAVYSSKTTTSSTLAWGHRPSDVPSFVDTREGTKFVGRKASVPAPGTAPSFNQDILASVSGSDTPHAASIPDLFTDVFFGGGCDPCRASRTARYLSLSTHDPVTGAISKSVARLSLFGESGSFFALQTFNVLTFGDNGVPAGHPVPRSVDGYVALDRATGEDADIHSITYPGETQTTVAPAPITTTSPERMPAWSPDGIKLGFVRHSGGQRKLGVFDATPGIQTVVNTPVAIGAEAPSPQTRAFQNVYGGMSIANAPPTTAPTIVCSTTCLNQLRIATTTQTVTLAPTVTSKTTIGIFVVRVRGKRRLLGRTAPRLRVVGRVPLGTARKGRNRFRWNGKVNGKRLKRGTYLLTYRSLKGKRVTNTSSSIRFKVAKGGKVRQVRRERVKTRRR